MRATVLVLLVHLDRDTLAATVPKLVIVGAVEVVLEAQDQVRQAAQAFLPILQAVRFQGVKAEPLFLLALAVVVKAVQTQAVEVAATELLVPQAAQVLLLSATNSKQHRRIENVRIHRHTASSTSNAVS
tara:strand:+ start:486 stop:872 length:387 start_codon:yes stop_codon:yes gene_type:complete